MARGRSKFLWGHTSHLIWIQAEINRDPKKRAEPFTPDDFDRSAPPKKKAPVPKVKMSEVKDILLSMGIKLTPR